MSEQMILVVAVGTLIIGIAALIFVIALSIGRTL